MITNERQTLVVLINLESYGTMVVISWRKKYAGGIPLKTPLLRALDNERDKDYPNSSCLELYSTRR